MQPINAQVNLMKGLIEMHNNYWKMITFWILNILEKLAR